MVEYRSDFKLLLIKNGEITNLFPYNGIFGRELGNNRESNHEAKENLKINERIFSSRLLTIIEHIKENISKKSDFVRIEGSIVFSEGAIVFNEFFKDKHEYFVYDWVTTLEKLLSKNETKDFKNYKDKI